MHVVITFVTRAFGRVSEFFEPTQPTTDRVPWERAILVAILLLGAFLRFWGLGEIGLHREDEDTTGLAAIHVLEDGVPRYPSGMPYARALVQSYLIAGAVYLFGNSEWSLRLPSALCGVLLIYLAYLLGRRFLSSSWNLVFAAAVACLPSLILTSQTARMYIFLLACLAGYAILVFAWERTGKLSRLVGAVLVLILGLQFQTLAIFAAPLLFFPPLLHADVRKFWWACAGAVLLLFAYEYIDYLVGLLYIEPDEIGGIGGGQPTHAHLVPSGRTLPIVAGIGVATFLAFILASRIGRTGVLRWIASLSILGGFACQLLLQYHLAAFLFAAGIVIALRENRAVLPMIAIVLGAAAALTVTQMIMLHAAGITQLRNMVGVMVGVPSVLSYVSLAEYSAGAVLLCGLGALAALWRLATRRAISDVWLMLVLWAWIPLLAIGVFIWNPAQRYTAPALLPTLLTAVFVLEKFANFAFARAAVRAPTLQVAAGVIGCLVVVNPLELPRSVHSGYDIHPDHKGAAEYIKSLNLGPDAILIAEDVIAQRYYLDKLDYWLLEEGQAAFFSRRVDGALVDIYTDTPIMGNGEQLASLVEAPSRGDIYIIGSGENQENGRAGMRGAGMHRIIASGIFPVVYNGRDGLTKVWKIGVLPPGTRVEDLLAAKSAADGSASAQPPSGDAQ